MSRSIRVHVFGKENCEKCKILNRRLDSLLNQKGNVFTKVYHDVETIEGLVRFAQTECMNPQRIPGFLFSIWDSEQKLEYVIPQDPNVNLSDSSVLATCLGLQTDYTGPGKGVISPKRIEQLFDKASSFLTS
jgi:hypothetical protein